MFPPKKPGARNGNRTRISALARPYNSRYMMRAGGKNFINFSGAVNFFARKKLPKISVLVYNKKRTPKNANPPNRWNPASESF